MTVQLYKDFFHISPKHSWILIHAFILDSASLAYETYLQSEVSPVFFLLFKMVILCLSSVSSYYNVLYWCLKGEHLFPLFITTLHIAGHQMCRSFLTPIFQFSLDTNRVSYSSIQFSSILSNTVYLELAPDSTG